MRLLLDTHALIWFTSGSPLLSPSARAAIEDPENEIFVSAVNALEISIKHRLGKLPSAEILAMHFEREVAIEGFASITITPTHARIAGAMTGAHGDPFDRILAAQAVLEGFTLVSRDTALDAFNVSRLW